MALNLYLHLGSRIPNEMRRECLKCFEKGMGYRATAKAAASAVRDYNRRYKKGDLSWAERGLKEPDHDSP